MSDGYVLVINNEDFTQNPRHGSSEDVRLLREFFQEKLCWPDFHLETDKTVEEMRKIVKRTSQTDFQRFSAFFMFILSHGCEEGIYGIQQGVIKVDEIIKHFSGEKCPSLVNKPKIFFMQACRGDMDDEGYTLQRDKMEKNFTNRINIPNFSDFLIAYPCVPGYTALRTRKGTVFIKTLVHILKHFCDKEHLVDMLIRVNYIVAGTNNLQTIKSMPCEDIRLRMKCYFYPFFDKVIKKFELGHEEDS